MVASRLFLAIGAALVPARMAHPPSVSEVNYTVEFDSARAAEQSIAVTISLQVDRAGPVLLSMPEWTPGAYEIDAFARNIMDFSARDATGPLDWDKTDFDTWRVVVSGPGPATVSYRYKANDLSCQSTWSAPDFAFFNGTALFLYPDLPGGAGLSMPARLTIRTEPEWVVINGMGRARGEGTFAADNFHELVDMPTFVGRAEVDSANVGGHWFYLTTYPSGTLSGDARARWWDEVERMIPPMEELWETVPFDDYTTLIAFDQESPGGSALEHRNSHLGVYSPALVGPELTWITAHEIFHAWNVKRLRPAEMVPYDYSQPQPTALLWMSEGVTEYYTHVMLVRAGLISPEEFYNRMFRNVSQVEGLPPVALEDASLSTWVAPVDGTETIYYEKGALAALLLDILIRDASANTHSLDDVMRDLYASTYRQGKGFTEEDFWEAASRAAGGRSFAEFVDRYIDGRDAYPWSEILPLGGIVLAADTTPVPSIGARLGINSASGRIQVSALSEGRPLSEAGAAVGDYLLKVGDVFFSGSTAVGEFQSRYGPGSEGEVVDVLVERDADTLTLKMKIQLTNRVTRGIRNDPHASPRAVEIRDGIFHKPQSVAPRTPPPSAGTVTDRDGNAYRTVEIGNQLWMAENLRSLHDSRGEQIESRAYRDDEALTSNYGRLYTWYAAMAESEEEGAQGICPTGWYIPSLDDWNALFRQAGGDAVAGGRLKEAGTLHWQAPNAGAVDEYGFSGVPGGGFSGGMYDGMGVGGHYWSSSGQGSQAPAPTLHRDTPEIVRLTLPKSFFLSVRCVKTEG